MTDHPQHPQPSMSNPSPTSPSSAKVAAVAATVAAAAAAAAQPPTTAVPPIAVPPPQKRSATDDHHQHSPLSSPSTVASGSQQQQPPAKKLKIDEGDEEALLLTANGDTHSTATAAADAARPASPARSTSPLRRSPSPGRQVASSASMPPPPPASSHLDSGSSGTQQPATSAMAVDAPVPVSVPAAPAPAPPADTAMDVSESAAPTTDADSEKQRQQAAALLREQMKWCLSTIKTLKRHHDASPFLQPVDPVALGIPDYFDRVKQPMDLGTVEKRLADGTYATHQQFVDDVRLTLDNCFSYNPPNHMVHQMGRNLEKAFNAQMKRLPLDYASIQPKSSLSSLVAGGGGAGGASQSPAISGAPRKWRKTDEIKYCSKVHNELMKKQYAHFMFVFYNPVDPVALNIPTYFDVVKHPMDLSTMKKKLDAGEYQSAAEYEADFRLVIGNCYTFNRPGDDVYLMGQRAEDLFNEKWGTGPPQPPPLAAHDTKHSGSATDLPGGGASSSAPKRKKSTGRVSMPSATAPSYDSDTDSSSDEDNLQIQMIEQQIAFLQTQLMTLRQSRKRRRSKKRKRDRKQQRRGSSAAGSMSAMGSAEGSTGSLAPPVASPTSATSGKQPPKPKQPRAPRAPRPPVKKKEPVIREITLEEKKELSEAINNMSGEKVARVIQIIHESMPHLGGENGQEEIELEINSLDLVTLNRLWNFVKGKKRRAKKPDTDKVAAASRITELERELAMMDGRMDKTKRYEQAAGFDNGTSTEGSDDDGSDGDSESE